MNSAYIGAEEMRGQVPGTTRNEARTKSAIKSRASGYVRAREGMARGIGAEHPRSSTTEISAVKYGDIICR